MFPGKKKCKILKEIRQEIANANDIEFVTSECTHKGDCRGTCPKCEAEVRYLEEELARRTRSGKKIAVASIVAGAMLTALPGCSGKGGSQGNVERIENSYGSDVDGFVGPEDTLCSIDSSECEPGEIQLVGEVAADDITPPKE